VHRPSIDHKYIVSIIALSFRYTTWKTDLNFLRLERARPEGGLRVSSISVWEIGIQTVKGSVQLSTPLRDWVRRSDCPVTYRK
jgi:hypothetical protein